MKFLYRITANFVWILHFCVVVIVLFGWAVPAIWPLYMSVLVLTLLSEVIWDYCLLSKWEFDLRKKLDPKLDYEYAYASYYTYKLTQGRLSRNFLNRFGRVFITASLIVNVYWMFMR